jgi:hypothetical protein
MPDVFGIGKAVEKLMDPVGELAKKLAGPAAEEVGLTLQDSVKIWRAKRRYRLFEKMNEFISNAGFEPKPVALKVLLPVLDYASVEEDEDLHTAWAALLANAADPRQGDSILPAFPHVLKELRPLDARFLSDLYNLTADRDNYGYRLDKQDLQLVYTLYNSAASEDFGFRPFQLAVSYLERLGVISKTYDTFSWTPDLKRVTESNHELTRFGVAFVRACRAPKQSDL